MTLSDVMDADEWQRVEQSEFRRDTLYRMLVDATRYWVIEHYLQTGKLPDATEFYAYANGPSGFGWGNPAGPDDGNEPRPLRGKRVRIVLEIEDR